MSGFIHKTIPISQLKNTVAISEMVHENSSPIVITKNGYEDMVILSAEAYNDTMTRLDIYLKLAESNQDIQEEKTEDARTSIASMRTKYAL